MPTFTVFRVFRAEVSRPVEAADFAEAAQKAKALKLERFLRTSPGAELLDWDDIPGMSIHEESE